MTNNLRPTADSWARELSGFSCYGTRQPNGALN